MKKTLFWSLLLPVALWTAAAENLQLRITPDHPDAIYRAGEPIRFAVELRDGEQPVVGRAFRYTLFEGDRVERRGEAVTGAEPVRIDSAGLPYPGWTRLEVETVEPDQSRPVRGGCGAMVDPLKLRSNRPEPADFDAFWEAQKAELAKVPMKVEEYPITPRDRGFDGYEVRIDCAGGKQVNGYLTLPTGAKPKSLPALVQLHGAGHKSASRDCRAGTLRFEINVHGILNGQPDEYYEELFRTELKNYPLQGRESRERCYFRGVFLRLLRALEYVKSRPEWNGRDLMVMGTSMGGGQALVAAALDPQVTLCIANDPAIIDHQGSLDTPKRRNGWPGLVDEKDPRTIVCSGYYDCVNFARRIKCETYVASGFMDVTCPSSAVYLAYNGIAGRKVMTTDPVAGHCRTRNTPGLARLDEVIRQAHAAD